MAKDKPKDKPKKEAGGGGGPALSVGIGRGVKLLLLFLIPVGALAAWCLLTWDGGPELRRSMSEERWWMLGRALGGAGLMGCVLWLLLPLAHWLRLYPIHRFATGSKVAWYLPLLLSLPVWLALYGGVLAGLGLGGWAIWDGLIHLGLQARLGF